MGLETKIAPYEQFIPATAQIGDNQTPLQHYLAEVNCYPVLNRDQQRAVFRCLRAGASIDDLKRDVSFEPDIFPLDEQYAYAFQQSQTLEELAFRCNLGLVVKEARKYPRFPTLDLIQEGNLGLMQAVVKHNPELGNFTSYARWWIRGAMLKAMPDLLTSAHIPGSMRRRINTIRNIEAEFMMNFGQKPSEAQLCQQVYERTGLSGRAIDTVIGIISSGLMFAISLDSSVVPDSEATFYDFVPDQSVNVEEEALSVVENEEYRNRKRPSAREAAANMGKSIPTARRASRRLVEAGLLPLHPRDPRTVDETGFTEHTRNLDVLVEGLLKQDSTMRNKELVVLLSDPSRLGTRVSTLTVARSRLRLATAGKTQRRILPQLFYRELDTQVEGLLKSDLTYEQIADTLKQPIRRVKTAGSRLRKTGKAESRAGTTEIRDAVARYLEEHRGEKINRSGIARQFGITREWARQLYDALQREIITI